MSHRPKRGSRGLRVRPPCICLEIPGFSTKLSHGPKRGSRGLRVRPPCICLEMRLGERTRLTKFGELTQDRQHPELTPENLEYDLECLSPFGTL